MLTRRSLTTLSWDFSGPAYPQAMRGVCLLWRDVPLLALSQWGGARWLCVLGLHLKLWEPS